MSLTPLRRLIFPCILLVIALVLYYAVPETPGELKGILDWLPYASLGMALALSGYNGHARPFAIAASLLIIYYLVTNRLQVSLSGPDALRIYSLVSAAFPLMMLCLLLMPDRGLWNRYGLIVIAIVPALIIAGVLIFYYVPEAAFLNFVEERMPVKPFPGYILSLQAGAAFGVVILAGLIKLIRQDSEYNAVPVVITVLVFLMLAMFDRPGISDVMFSLAGISLIVSMMRAGYELAYRDELTGLPGRRALNERLDSLGRRYVIAMLDVDHFKKFNDTYGHDSGDDVLKMVAKQLAAVGGGGTAYRYGGEEFCIVFPGKDMEACRPFLEALRGTIAAYKIQLRDIQNRPRSEKAAEERRGRRAKSRNGKGVSVTISIGVAAQDGGTVPAEEVIKAADAALYRAKNKGRNCLVTAS
ncbi:MAG: GGDEF domain-containing protein [Gammaproteobacteria bacterium]